MARKKKEETVESTVPRKESLASRLAAIDKLLEKATEEGIAVGGRPSKSEAVKERLTFKFIPTPCDALNEALGGGFLKGKFTTVSGLEDSGKTFLLIETIAQHMSVDPDFSVIWAEAEDTLDKKKISKIFPSIDWDRFIVLYPTREGGAEGVANLLESALQILSPDMIVINTLKMLIPKSEIDKPLDKVSVAAQARFNADFVKKFLTLCGEKRTAMILIQQLTTKIGTYGDPLVIGGGNSIRYNSMVLMDLRSCSIADTDPITKDTGKKIHALIKKNHAVIDRNPYCTIEYFVEYGKGIEQTMTLLKQLLEKGILTKRGAYIDLLDENGEQQEGWTWYGKNAFKKDVEEHPEKMEKLKSLIAGNMTQDVSEEEMAEIKAEEEAEAKALKEEK
jgi:recombination protein RecA